MASLNMGSMMRLSGPYKGIAWSNMPEEVKTYVKQMAEMGIKPEMEVYSHAMYREVEGLIKKGLLKKPYYVNLVMGMTLARTVRIARELNKGPATPDEAREILGL